MRAAMGVHECCDVYALKGLLCVCMRAAMYMHWGCYVRRLAPVECVPTEEHASPGGVLTEGVAWWPVLLHAASSACLEERRLGSTATLTAVYTLQPRCSLQPRCAMLLACNRKLTRTALCSSEVIAPACNDPVTYGRRAFCIRILQEDNIIRACVDAVYSRCTNYIRIVDCSSCY